MDTGYLQYFYYYYQFLHIYQLVHGTLFSLFFSVSLCFFLLLFLFYKTSLAQELTFVNVRNQMTKELLHVELPEPHKYHTYRTKEKMLYERHREVVSASTVMSVSEEKKERKGQHVFTENESILAALFLWWYTGNEKKSMTVLSKLLQCTTSNHHLQYTSSLLQIKHILDRETVENAWRSRWFAKGKQTHIVDDFMKEEYASLLLNESFVEKWTNVTKEILDDLPVWLLLSLLILFDQVPRNIFRGTLLKKLLIFSSSFSQLF